MNLNGPTAYQVEVFDVTGLGNGTHALNVKTGNKRRQSNCQMFVNAAEVLQ